MKRYVLTLAYALITEFMLGQVANYIPPSPNAAALAKVVDVQVSEYTGVPNISLPIYTIKSGDLTLPITLDYHASGIKVEEEASWVGLGWSLNAGGCITRQIRGKDDFRPNLNGYISLDNLPPSTNTNLPQWGTSLANDSYFDYYTNVANGSYDGEPDLFYYNFNGKSGKLVFEKQSGTIVNGISLSQNSIKFSYNMLSRCWEVIDENGVKYSFMTNEETKNYSYSGDIRYEQSTCYEEIDGDNDTKITAWYLNKIESPTGYTISFEYDYNTNQTITQVQHSELIYQLYDIKLINTGGKGYISPNFFGYKEIHTASMQETAQVWLKSISFANGLLKFKTSDRSDLVSRNTNKPQKLDNLEIYDKYNTLIKSFNLNYSYFNQDLGTPDSERLKLNSIQEFAGGKTIPAHEFSYNTVSLPSKTSYSQDHWGYYNGKNNESIRQYELINVINHLNNVYGVSIDSQYGTDCKKTLIPYREEKNGDKDVFINGANREPDPLAMQAAVLTKIRYPTGGSTEFVYEPNQYQSTQPMNKDTTIYKSVEFWMNKSDNESTINLDQNTFLFLDYRLIEYEYGNPNTYATVIAELRNADNNDSKIIQFMPSSSRFESHIAVCLPPGKYTLYVNSPDDQYDYQEIKATYKKKIPTTKNIGGGLRINRIITKNESQAITNIDAYSYEDLGITTGKIMSPLTYYHAETVLGTNYIIQPGNIVKYIYEGTYLIQNSNSSIPLGNSAQGNPIGYDMVIKKQISANGTLNGKTISYYWNTPNNPTTNFMPNVPYGIHNENGLLKKLEIYDNDNLLVRKIINYTKSSTSLLNIKGLKIGRFIYGDDGGQIRFYDNNSEWWYMSSEITDTYSQGNQSNYIRTTNNYFYENTLNKLLTRKSTFKSDNTLVETKIKYSTDYSDPISIGMTDKNMIGLPIETYTLRNGKVVNAEKTEYFNISGMYLPKKIYETQISTPVLESDYSSYYKPILNFDKYDTKGQPIQITDKNDITIVYLWSYNNLYLVAEIKNTTYSQLEAILGSAYISNLATNANPSDDDLAPLNNLRYNRNYPNIQVTTFKYIPLIGMTQQTDPRGITTYYKYDDFNRLEETYIIETGQKKIVQKFDYHYATQQ